VGEGAVRVGEEEGQEEEEEEEVAEMDRPHKCLYRFRLGKRGASVEKAKRRGNWPIG